MTTPANKDYSLVLVDGSSYLFRAFHALPPLTNKAGEATGAVFGVLNMLRKLIADVQPDYFAVVFDASGKTFRNDMYGEYKANRPPMPDELRSQIEPLHKIIRANGWPLISVKGVEADDVIGTLCQQASAAGMDTLVSTGDKDLAQLVNDHVTLINTMSNQWLDIAGVEAKFGVPPEKIIDYLALMGDTVDNVPGVTKVGPKTAVKLLAQHESLEGVMAAADSIKGKLGENVRDAVAHLPLSKELVTIKCDVELDVVPQELLSVEIDAPALTEWYSRFGFNKLLAELGGEAPAAVAAEAPESAHINAVPDGNYECVTDKGDFQRWLKILNAAEIFAFDTETTSLDYMQAEIVGVSFAVEAGSAAYVPLAHDYPGAPDQLAREWVLEQLKPLLEDESHSKVGQHLKYDAHVLMHYGITLRGIAHDTMLESYVLDSVATRHDMDSLAKHYLDRGTTKFEEVAGKGAKQLTFNQVELEVASDYAAEDADVTLQLHQAVWPQLQAQPKVASVYTDIELPLIPILTAIEHRGVLIDRKALGEQSQQLAERMAELEQAAYEAADQPFNLGSPKQLQEILFEKQGLPVIKKTPKGAPSTAEDVLVELAEQEFELPKLIIEHRSLSKLKSTYTDNLPKQIDAKTGRVHTSYHQAIAATGRLSSSNPNLQNIPIRTVEGRRVREAFIAGKGRVLLAADYSQVELRIMAHLSGDQGLLKAFQNGEDIHRATAAEVFGTSDVTSEQRRSAKAINFGLIYGMSAFGLAKQLGVGRGEAQEYIDLYFARYPGVKRFMDNTRAAAHEDGYVETVFGRRLYLPEINSRNGQRRQYAERTAINAPMQGTAADIIKRAMISVHGWLQETGLPAEIIMQVHDELVLEVDEAAADEVAAGVVERMEQAAELKVPLEVECGRGKSWDAAH